MDTVKSVNLSQEAVVAGAREVKAAKEKVREEARDPRDRPPPPPLLRLVATRYATMSVQNHVLPHRLRCHQVRVPRAKGRVKAARKALAQTRSPISVHATQPNRTLITEDAHVIASAASVITLL